MPTFHLISTAEAPEGRATASRSPAGEARDAKLARLEAALAQVAGLMVQHEEAGNDPAYLLPIFSRFEQEIEVLREAEDVLARARRIAAAAAERERDVALAKGSVALTPPALGVIAGRGLPVRGGARGAVSPANLPASGH